MKKGHNSCQGHHVEQDAVFFTLEAVLTLMEMTIYWGGD